MKIIKKLCENCGGVINGKIFSSSTGEKPCKCGSKNKSRKLAKFWKNGRDLQNS